jgi:hypothetical protein
VLDPAGKGLANFIQKRERGFFSNLLAMSETFGSNEWEELLNESRHPHPVTGFPKRLHQKVEFLTMKQKQHATGKKARKPASPQARKPASQR